MNLLPVIAVLLLTGIAMSCSNDEVNGGKEGSETSLIDHISVALMTRDGNDEEDLDEDNISDDELTDADFKRLYGMPFTLNFDSNSVIFVSQQTERVSPFQTSDGIYAYKYIEDNQANWEDDYNFTPLDLDDPLEWYKIGNRGSYRGGFALYALYFPKREEILQREENGKIIYSVEQDQSTLDNLIKSDILGAYHSNPTLFTRLRFNMFHLMTYLRIRLYVPVYDPASRTGYFDDSLISANLDHTTPDFTIEWSAMRSSDTEGPAISPLTGEGAIIMYQHPLEDGEEREIKEIPYEQYIPTEYFEQPIEGDYDTVKVYDFSVIMPMQGSSKNAEGKDQAFTQTNFLNFILRSNSGAENKYIFNQTLTANSTGSNLQLNQGIFQYLELYVPRVGNKVIYVTGNMKPWLENMTSLPLHREDEDPGGNTEETE